MHFHLTDRLVDIYFVHCSKQHTTNNSLDGLSLLSVSFKILLFSSLAVRRAPPTIYAGAVWV